MYISDYMTISENYTASLNAASIHLNDSPLPNALYWSLQVTNSLSDYAPSVGPMIDVLSGICALAFRVVVAGSAMIRPLLSVTREILIPGLEHEGEASVLLFMTRGGIREASVLLFMTRRRNYI